MLVACGGVGKGSSAANDVLPPVNPGPYGTHLWVGNVIFTGGGQGVYQQLMKDRGICGGGHWYAWSGVNCEQWNDAAQVQLEITGNGILPTNGALYVTAFNDYNPYQYVIMNFPGRVDPINVNTAFAIQVLNTFEGYNKYLRAEGNVASLASSSAMLAQYKLVLSYNGQEIGYSTMNLYY